MDLNVTYFEGLEQDCSNSIANALELLQSCTKPSICSNSKLPYHHGWTLYTDPPPINRKYQGPIINTLRQRQNGRHFPGAIFKCISFNEDV